MRKRKQPRKYKLSDIMPKYNADNFTPEQEELRIEENEATIDEKFEDFAEYLGREITDDEEEALLRIVDKYTPVNKKGDYLVDLLPFDYAWKIYQAQKDNELEDFMEKLEVESEK